MTGSPARFRRKLQFRSGPESYTFAACLEHVDRLIVRSQLPDCFFLDRARDPLMLMIDYIEDPEQCDFCKEG